jgi:hypothetical protein
MDVFNTYVRVKSVLSQLDESKSSLVVNPSMSFKLARVQGPVGVSGNRIYNPAIPSIFEVVQPILHELNSTFAPRGMVFKVSYTRAPVTLLVFLPHTSLKGVQINGQVMKTSINESNLTYVAFYSDTAYTCPQSDASIYLDIVPYDPVRQELKNEFSKFESKTDAFIYNSLPKNVILHSELSWFMSVEQLTEQIDATPVTLLVGNEFPPIGMNKALLAYLKVKFDLSLTWIVLKQTKTGTSHSELSIHPFNSKEVLQVVGGSRGAEITLLNSFTSSNEFLPSEYLYGSLGVTLERKKNLCSTTKTKT